MKNDPDVLRSMLACAWVYQDAKSRGKGLGYVIPFFVLTAASIPLGSMLNYTY